MRDRKMSSHESAFVTGSAVSIDGGSSGPYPTLALAGT
jgi:hypothetical protein